MNIKTIFPKHWKLLKKNNSCDTDTAEYQYHNDNLGATATDNEQISKQKIITLQSNIKTLELTGNNAEHQRNKFQKELEKTTKRTTAEENGQPINIKEQPSTEKGRLPNTKDDNNFSQENARLKHKIKKLTEEYDEIEEERDELQTQLQRKKKELSEIEDVATELKHNNTKLEREIKNLNESLAEKTSNLESKQQALGFVQEILKAPLVNDDEKRNKLEKAIQKLYDFIRDELQEHLSKHVEEGHIEGDFSLPTIKESLDRWAALERKTWIKGKVSIAFIGEFSAGKTSLVNRILSQDNPNVTLLPVSTKATTAIPTYISHADTKPAFQFISPDNNLKKMREETFKSVSKAILDEVQGISSLITYFIMEYKNDHLKNLSILDTPGFSSNDSEDAQRTIEVINECDALFWVFDVNAGTINRKSIGTIREHLRRPLHIVINKVDTKSEKEVEAVQKLIQETLDKEGLCVEAYHRFSNKEPIGSIMAPIKALADIGKETNSFLYDLEKALETIETNMAKRRKLTLETRKKLSDEVNSKKNILKSTLGKIEDESKRLKEYLVLKEKGFFSSKKEYKLDECSGNELLSFFKNIESEFDFLIKAGSDIEDYSKEMERKETELKHISYLIERSEEISSKLKSLTKELN